MRIIRLFLYFVVGVLLSAVAVFAHSETMPVGTVYRIASCPNTSYVECGSYVGTQYATLTEACAPAGTSAILKSDQTFYHYVSQRTPTSTSCGINVNQRCGSSWCSGYSISVFSLTSVQGCPTGWTQDGQTCTKPDVCPTTSTSGYYSMGSSEDISGDYCENSCGYTLSLNLAGGDVFSSSSKRWLPMNKTGTGQSCSASNPTPEGSPALPNEPEKVPPCATGEGVIATSEGQVYCVPEALPGSDEPVVQKKVEKETFPDGSEKTTTTTQTCTGAGACTTTTITNVTGVGGGTTPGEAGTPGTTEGTSTKPGNETAGFCAEHPGLQICGNNMNDERTQQKILAEIKKLTDPTLPTDNTAITGAKHSDESQTALDAENKKYTDGGSGAVNPVGDKQGAWSSAMESGWFSDIPMTGCTPFVLSPLGKSFVLDHCAVAAQVSDIGAYALWIVLSVGVFVMLTGGRREA